MSLIYAEGHYWIYHSSSLNIKVNQKGVHRIDNGEKKENQPSLLKELNEKIWMPIKFINQPVKKKKKQKEGELCPDEGSIKLVPGDILKFGRVPFIVKETSSIDKINDFWGTDEQTFRGRSRMRGSQDQNNTDAESLLEFSSNVLRNPILVARNSENQRINLQPSFDPNST